jgi:hypothetical protein
MPSPPPARKLWELIWYGWNPYCCRLSCMTAALIAELMSAARSTLPDVCVKYVLIIVCPAEVLLEMRCNLLMSAFTGHVFPCFASWWTDWFRFPFFWVSMFIVAAVHWVNSVDNGSVLSRMVFLFQRVLSCTQNCCVRVHLFPSRVYSPTRRR